MYIIVYGKILPWIKIRDAHISYIIKNHFFLSQIKSEWVEFWVCPIISIVDPPPPPFKNVQNYFNGLGLGLQLGLELRLGLGLALGLGLWLGLG